MTQPAATPRHLVRLSETGRRPVPFELGPDAKGRADLAARLGILGVRKLRFAGELRPSGARDWHLAGELGATVVQACGVTLAPVATRIDESVERRYLAEMPDLPEGAEVEMPEDDTAEPLPATIDLAAVMEEALALALPPFPRAEGAELAQTDYAAPGTSPMTDDDARPFAGLKHLLDRGPEGE